MLIYDDCLNAMSSMESLSIDMIYLDPPFFTQKNQILRDKQGTVYNFSDVWDSLEQYLSFMKIRLMEMKRILKDSGTIFLHCDHKASHHLRLLLDEVFGPENFLSEIIWTYKRWSNSKKGLLPGHQVIYFYSKTKHYKFNTIYGNYSPTTNLDQILQERVRDHNGKATYKKDVNGNIILGKEKQGVPLSDVWEIPFLNPKARERTGYPTQKPIELLEKIIKISTDEGDVVLDPFCGSGTTLVSAALLNRNYIGIDKNPAAITLSQNRLDHPLKTKSNLLKLGISAYQTKTEYERSILQQFDCDIVQRNKGIDALLKKHYMGAPVAIKIQKQDEDILYAAQLLHNAASKRGCIVSVLITNEYPIEITLNQIPSNIIVLPQYQATVSHLLDEKLDSYRAANTQ